MKKLLVFSPVNFIPPTDGIRQAIYYRYKYLSVDFDIHIVLLGLSTNESNQVDLKEYSKYFKKVEIFPSDLQPSSKLGLINKLKKMYFFLFSMVPFHVSRCAPLKYTRDVKKMIIQNKYDHIILEDVFGFNILKKVEDQILNRSLCVLHAYPSKQRLIQFETNNKDNLFHKIYKYSDFLKMLLFEKKLFSKLNKLICISFDDTEKINNRFNFRKIKYCPIVLEFQNKLRKNNYQIKSRAKLIFMAPSYSVNDRALDWFVQKVMPLIKSDFKIHLVGSICNYYQENYSLNEKIKLFGFCDNERKIELLLQSDVFINPIKHGTGVKIKNIEAMSLGLPIVTTSVGAYGLEKDWQKSLMVEDIPEHFANAIDSLISSENKRKELGDNAFNYFKEHFTPESSVIKWKDIIESTIS